MVNNKKQSREKREKSPPEYRTKQERQEEVKPIIAKLTELRLTIDYDEVKELFIKCKQYIDTGDRVKLSIPFPAIGRTIVGVLASESKHGLKWKNINVSTTKINHIIQLL